MKNILKIFLPILILSIILLSVTSFAQVTTHKSVTDIIAGKQDRLVFASVVNVQGNVVTVDVTEEIGAYSKVDKDGEDDSEDETKLPPIEGEEIDVAGLKSYMYFDGYDYHPKKGDNVLLSLTFNGNVYSVKNGAFRVSSASYDNFVFEVPIEVKETDGAIELTALYKFVSSDGRNADFTVKDSAVYTHDPDGAEIVIREPSGVSYIDAHGKTVQPHTPADTGNGWSYTMNPYKWIVASLLILIGVISGFFVSRLVFNFEKRSEEK